jgi:hypothetical protein
LAGSQKRIENDYEDTITKHEYEHEHAYEYDARRHDYDLQCDRIPGEVALQANADVADPAARNLIVPVPCP